MVKMAKPIEEHIRFLGGEVPKKDINVTLHYQNNDGYYDCEIHYDGIPVAYFDTSGGGIVAIVFELHYYTRKNKQFWDNLRNANAEVLRDIQYLESKGVDFDVKERHTKQYCIKLEQGFY
jgi:hypothetical protein